MALIDCLRAANNARAADYQALYIAGQRVGLIRRTQKSLLADYGFHLYAQGEALHWQSQGDCAANTAFLADICRQMAKDGIVQGWRDELYPIAIDYQQLPLALVERAAMPLFGARGYGVHVNGLVQKTDGIYMWLGKRAADKPTSPNKLDQIAAGGLPYGISVFANMQKECAEEANIPAALSAQARAVGMGSYYHEVANGIRADMMFFYDLWLPADFIPSNSDGEVAEFFCYPLSEIIAMLRQDNHSIKYNSALAIIDCAIRHQLITPDEAHYQSICHLLRAQDHFGENFPV